MQSHTLDQVIDAIRHHHQFLLSAHVDPEGDCVASLLALDSLLRKLNKESSILCEDPLPEQLRFLDNGRWRTLHETPAPGKVDVGVVVDCPSLERIGRVRNLFEASGAFLINIDHHVSNRYFGAINYVDAGAAASGELIYDLFKALNVPLSDEDRRAIYVSLSTDTGSFRYSNTTSKTHEIAADLLRQGLDTGTLNELLYENMPGRKLALFQIFLNRIELLESGKVACAVLHEKDLSKSGALKNDLEGFVEFMRSVSGVKVAFLVTEQGKNARVSFRSKGDFDVNALAGHFGGGGHRKASGCTINSGVREAKRKIIEKIRTNE